MSTDPRFAYFQNCKEQNCLPRANLLIKDTENPVIDFTNKFLATTQAATSVAEAVKRYTFPVLAIIFVNNSLKPREAKIIMESFQHHISTITTINLSQNNLSLSGAEYLASCVPAMRSIKNLYLNDCHLGDRGVKVIVNKLEESTALDLLDLSGNQIGQSSYFKDSVAALCSYLHKSTQLNDLLLNHNMLRGPLGFALLDTISQH